jgi:hypothetical protein
MSESTNKVTVVFDPNFGQELELLAGDGHVWVVDTPSNRAVAESYWEQNPGHGVENGITTFKLYANETAAERCLALLPIVELHHGPNSSERPYSVLEVIGVPLSEVLKSAVEELGFRIPEERAEGFRATRP